MTRERRSLWGSISTSDKVNRLSLKAALLYTWSIPHEDDEGFQEGDLKSLKHMVVPFREDIPLGDLKPLFIEIVTIHKKINDSMPLWRVFHIGNKVFIQNPVHNDRQTYHGIHKIKSKIKYLVGDTPETVFEVTPNGAVVVHKLSEVKLSEVKGSEVKGKGDQNLFFSKKEEEQKKKEKEEINRKIPIYKEKEMRMKT
jgi:hypothetical protein